MENTQFRSLPRGRIHLLIALIAYRDSACVSIRISHDTDLVFGMALARTAPRRRSVDDGGLSHISTILVPESWHTITKWGPDCGSAPFAPNPGTAPWFLHGDGLSRPLTKLAPYCNSSGTEDFLNWDDETAVAASCAWNFLRCRAGD